MAKNTRSGLGRGLNSLMGGYEAPAEASSRKKSEQLENLSSEAAPEVRKAVEELPRRSVEREVIREENLTQEDRAVIDREKRKFSAPTKASDPLGVKIAVKDVIAKKELIEEDDGVTIKGVVERIANPEAAARYSAETSASSSPSFAERMEARVSAVSTSSAEETGHVRATDEVDIDKIHPNPTQPRMHFNQDELEELSASIEKDGLLQPILVREAEDGYEIIAGERRWQACKLVGLKKVPVRIKEADDLKVLELALIENLQRSDLNPIEEAYSYKRMMERSGRTQSEVASAVSKGRSTIANALRLLDLPEEAQQLLFEEKITAGHARAILSVQTPANRLKLTEKLKNEKISVREAESIARLMVGRENAATKPPKPPAPKAYKTTARSLGEKLHTKVKIRSVNGKNKIEIEFKDEDDLQRLFEIMNGSEQ